MKYFHFPFKGEVHNCLKDATYPLPEERLVESRRKEHSSLIMSFLVKTLHPLAISIHFRLVLTSDLMGMQWWLDKCICHQYKSCQMRWVWFISKHFYIKLGVGSWKSMHISASSLARWSASKPCFCFQWLLRLLVSWSIFPQLKLVKFELRCAEFLLDFVLVNKNLKNCALLLFTVAWDPDCSRCKYQNGIGFVPGEYCMVYYMVSLFKSLWFDTHVVWNCGYLELIIHSLVLHFQQQLHSTLSKSGKTQWFYDKYSRPNRIHHLYCTCVQN